MLEITNLNVRYNKRPAVANINLRLQAGGILGIIGPNGAGKSTLLRAIAGLCPYDGDIRLFDEDVSRVNRAKSVAVLGQNNAFNPSFSVYDMVMTGRYAHMGFLGRASKKDREQTDKAIAAMDIWDIKGQPLGQLSGGQLQRAFMARTLAQAPKLILLDEPANHLDIAHQDELLSTLKALNKERGIAIIAVLHDINMAIDLCPNLILMDKGRIAAQGESKSLVSALSRVYDMDIAAHMQRKFSFWR